MLKEYVLSDGVTQSMLAAFLSCRQRMRYILDHWESEAFGNSAERGNAFHLLLEKWYSGLWKEHLPCMNENLKQWQEELRKRGPVDPNSMEDTLAFCEALFPEYVKRWQKSDALYKWVALEQVFDQKFKGFRLRGKMDGLLKLNGKLWLFETKTKATIEEDSMLDALAFDFQNLFYLTVLAEAGTPAIGVIYNIIRKPGLRQKKDEDRQQFAQRMIEDVAERPDHYFKRYEIRYTKEAVANFRKELELKLDDFKYWLMGEEAHYRNESVCIGRFKCPFLRACATGSMVGYKQTRELFSELKA
jgi:hypothetical protein